MYYTPKHRADQPETPEPWIVLSFDQDDPYTIHVKAMPEGIAKDVNIGPVPTWPSPSELSDMVANVVRDLLDETHVYWTGEAVER